MMDQYRKITRQVVLSYLVLVLYFCLNPVLMFILTHTLSVADYGIYSLLMATITVLAIVLELGLSQYIATKFPGLTRTDKIRSFVSILLFEFILLGVIVAMLRFMRNVLAGFFKVTAPVYTIVLIVICAELLFRLVTAYFYAEQRVAFNNFTDLLRRILLVILLLVHSFSLYQVFFYWLLSIVTVIALCLVIIRDDIALFFKDTILLPKVVMAALRFGILLMPIILTSWVLVLLDRYILNYFWGTETVAVYSLAYSVTGIIVTVSSVLTSVFYPFIAEAWNTMKSTDTYFNAVFKYNLLILLPGMIGLVLLRNKIIAFISGAQYISGAPVMVALIAYPLFASLVNILYYNILIREKQKIGMIIYILGALLNLALNLLLIPHHGMIGAAVATVVSYIGVFIGLLVVSYGTLQVNLKFIRPVRIIGAAIIMGIIVSFVNTLLIQIVVGIVVYGVLAVGSGVFERDELRRIISFFGH